MNSRSEKQGVTVIVLNNAKAKHSLSLNVALGPKSLIQYSNLVKVGNIQVLNKVLL